MEVSTRDRSTPAFWFHLWCQTARWQRAVDQALAPWKLAHTRFMLLDMAERLEGEIEDAFQQVALADATGLDPSSVSTAVRMLEQHGLIDRDIDGLDARMSRLRVTAAGRRLLARTRPIVAGLAAELSRKSG